MLAGLLRLRRRGGGWHDMGCILWKQVSWQCIFVDRGCCPCANVIMHSRGCPLALACNRHRARSSGTFIILFSTPPLTPRFMSQVFMCLDLNGNLLSSDLTVKLMKSVDSTAQLQLR
jgi:hypothetical protein